MAALKHLVSKKKIRYEEDGFDLDLTYIASNVIAMGFPAESLEGVYRNNMKDVQRFFNEKHADSYKIYNLCSEREYDVAKFDGRCERFPFDDHNPCPLSMLYPFCLSVDEFLAADSNNVVAIHCKAGKGRTGLMIALYLLHCTLSGRPLVSVEGNPIECDTADKALEYFGHVRTADDKGVTIPSQMRYVRYYEHIFPALSAGGGDDDYNVSVTLLSLEMSSAPNFDIGGGCDPFVKINVDNTEVFSNKCEKHAKNEPVTITFPDGGVELCGNVKISTYDKDLTSSEKMAWMWIHSALLPISTAAASDTEVVFTKNELDGAIKDKNNAHFQEDFTVTLRFAAA